MNPMQSADPTSAPTAPGKRLAAIRTERGMSIADVAQHLKFARRQIEALEADDYAALPGMTIIRGMVRSYAKLLKIDPEPLLAELQMRLVPMAEIDQVGMKAIPFPSRVPKYRSYQWIIAGSAAAIVLLVSTEWLRVAHERPERPLSAGSPGVPSPSAGPSVGVGAASSPEESKGPATQTSGTPITQDLVVASPVAAGLLPLSATPPLAMTKQSLGKMSLLAAGKRRLLLRFEHDSWVEIKTAGGVILMSQLNLAGTEKTVEGAAPLKLVIGAATGVKLLYNDGPVDLAPHTSSDVARLTLP
jgi:cytoskeleton protein RodZ